MLRIILSDYSEEGGKPPTKHVGQLVPAINLSDRGIEEKICLEFKGNS